MYEQFYQLEDIHWWFRARRRYIEKIISGLFEVDQQRLKFCEIGAGTGGNLPLLTRFASVDAVEMNDTARNIIKTKNIEGVRHLYPGHLPDDMPTLKLYDAVFSLDVIEHVQDDIAALAQLKAYVKENGYLITTVPAYQWLWSAHDEANQHYRRYTLKGYRELVKSTGLKIVYASYFNTLLFPLAAGARVLENCKPVKDNTEEGIGDLELPYSTVNFLFRKIFELESSIAGKVRMPFGLSIIVIAKNKHI